MAGDHVFDELYLDWKEISKEGLPPDSKLIGSKSYYTLSQNFENTEWDIKCCAYYEGNFMQDQHALQNVVYWAELPDTPDYIKK